ncbi:MAG: 2-oxo acid dehydrogenase subunit E2, partial [Acidobacteria bacterium]|nr:2-oxo acid dehydrogenase subunit E2 [Acidobacteriota bacterium]MCA1637209.1 2-oxo acid dehydrogenase subunit E2 [Acidobacteriota bacterium]
MNKKEANLSEYITENFGANASYVEGLLNRYQSDPNLVDESWRTFFGELLNGGSPLETNNNQAATVQSKETSAAASAKTDKTNGSAKAKAEIPTTAKKQTVLGAGVEVKPIVGASKKIVENMEESLGVPTATSLRRVPVKVLEENRRVINENLQSAGRGKVSFTHLIAWAIIKALKEYPQLNFGYGFVNNAPSRLENKNINLGIAIDIEKKDGSRNLLVPNIKGAEKMNFAEFFAAYNETVKKARDGKLTIEDFQGTTISLTNPGTIGTVSSNPRLMAGQSVIIATGAIEYPAEYQAMTAAALSQLGISKTITLTSTYDHRVIQGAESGLFLAKIHEFL